jgi:hypothetical protein
MIPAMERFIEKAKKGGWREVHEVRMVPESILLDPAAWRAVGKVEGWPETKRRRTGSYLFGGWVLKMHCMIDALAAAEENGQSQEEALEAYLDTVV